MIAEQTASQFFSLLSSLRAIQAFQLLQDKCLDLFKVGVGPVLRVDGLVLCAQVSKVVDLLFAFRTFLRRQTVAMGHRLTKHAQTRVNVVAK